MLGRGCFHWNIAAEFMPKRYSRRPNFFGSVQDVRVLAHPRTGQAFGSPVGARHRMAGRSGHTADTRWPPTPRGRRRSPSAPARFPKSMPLVSVCRACPRLVELARGGRGRQTPSLCRPAVLGAPGARLGVGAAAAADRRIGARRARRQPHRTDVHRRPLGRPVVRGAVPGRAGEPTDQCRRCGWVADQEDSHRRAGAVRAARPTPRRPRSGTPAGRGCRPNGGWCPRMFAWSWPWAGSAGRSRCGCRAPRPGAKPRFGHGVVADLRARCAFARLLPPEPAKHVHR